ncbi:MAG: hypothetical protein ED859_08365 [Desulfuromonadales bacterium]|nr:MAG: hypothetical protein ED859_08365 [Desulfuromonadales bacterium]
MILSDAAARLIAERREAILVRAGAGHRSLVGECADRIVAHNVRMTGLGTRASKFCARGCARCCAMIFFASPAEVEVIAFHLLERPELLRVFLLNSLERERMILPHEGLYRRCQAATLCDDANLAAFYALDIRCAFNVEGACAIYPVRPLACSLYNSIVPADVCAVEPKAYETEEMRMHHGDARRWLAGHVRSFPVRDGQRLDVSRKVLVRLIDLVDSVT